MARTILQPAATAKRGAPPNRSNFRSGAQGKHLEILNDSCEMEHVAGVSEAAQPQASDTIMHLQVRSSHLDALPSAGYPGGRSLMSRLAQMSMILMTAIAAATAAPAQTTLKIDGSTGAMPLVAALARTYEAKTADLKIEIGSGLGTKARIEALSAGSIDLAVASHGLKRGELLNLGMTVDEIARTPVVFGVNASVSVTSLTQAQICAIYSGALANWSAVGGPDLTIAPRTRPDSEVDAEVVRAGVPCLKTLKMPDAVKVLQRGGDMAKELAATAGAIGMTTTTVTEQSGGRIKALALDGVAPAEENVTDGKYRLVREVFLVAQGNASPATKAFLAFVKSAEGAKIIKTNGAIPSIGR